MKKNKFIVAGAAALLATGILTGCGSSKEKISIWVGQESVEFYQKVTQEYLKDHKDFGFDIRVVAADTGSAAAQLLTDNTACADIVTIAHDNIGKLSRKAKILPITNGALLDQIAADNPESFKKVIVNKLGAASDAPEFTFAVPYISQALFLYYNKEFVSEEQALTFEGLQEAATAADKKAFTITGTDSFNFSFTTLAVRNADKYTSTKIYEDFKMSKCFFQGNDTVAVSRWAQDIFADPHGGAFPSSSGWTIDFGNKNVLSFVGGAWHYNAALKAIGEENLGCAMIPTFKLKDSDVEGLTANEFDSNVPQAGDEYRGGTFADCKCFVINGAAAESKDKAINDLLMYLTSKEMQNRSYTEAFNIPAYKGALEYVESTKDSVSRSTYEMAKSQIAMAEYGQPQPFATGILNTYFYSKGADSAYKQMIINDKGAYDDTQAIRKTLYEIEHTWTKGKKPESFPAELPAAMPGK